MEMEFCGMVFEEMEFWEMVFEEMEFWEMEIYEMVFQVDLLTPDLYHNSQDHLLVQGHPLQEEKQEDLDA